MLDQDAGHIGGHKLKLNIYSGNDLFFMQNLFMTIEIFISLETYVAF